MNKFWKQCKAWFFMMWRPILAFMVVAIVVGLFYGFRLGSLTPGASASEKSYISSIHSGRDLLKHPVYIVHKLPVYLLVKLHVHSLSLFRAVSALMATIAAISCFFILREWYSDRIAILGTWLFLTSAWILHTGRLATPEASFLLMMPLLWAAVWLYNTTLRKTALIVLSFLIAANFYIPGFGWLLIVVAVWQRKKIWAELKQVPVWFRVICASIIIIGLIPLIWASAAYPKELLLAAGLPDHLPQIKTILSNLVSLPMQIILFGPNNPSNWLGRLPLLDIFSVVMLALGIYSMRFHLKLARVQTMLFSFVLLSVLIISDGPVTVSVLLPTIYILIAGGVAFMLQQWFTVFPHNPIARTIATTLISISILLVSFYHISHYFIAWPEAPATRAVFRQTL